MEVSLAGINGLCVIFVNIKVSASEREQATPLPGGVIDSLFKVCQRAECHLALCLSHSQCAC